MKPDTVLSTPGTLSKSASVHQKQPEPNVAFEVVCCATDSNGSVAKARIAHIFEIKRKFIGLFTGLS